MRGAFIGDIHANDRFLWHVLQYCVDKEVDVLFPVGDFGYRYTPKFMKMVADHLKTNNQKMYVTMGNHDDYPYVKSITKPVSGETYRSFDKNLFFFDRPGYVVLGDTKIMSMGGAVSIDRTERVWGSSWWPEELPSYMETYNAYTMAENVTPDIMVTHDLPLFAFEAMALPPIVLSNEIRHDDRGFKKFLEEMVLTASPKRVIAGHYHIRWAQKIQGIEFDVLDMDGGKIQDNVLIVDL